MPVDEHRNDYDEDWAPESPILRGEVRVPDDPVIDGNRIIGPPDQLPHRIRRELGIDDDEPDPGYDPDADDLVPA
jgi:hypothetical protein